MRKPFENKKVYDPGRLRNPVLFLQEQPFDDGFGGTTVSEVEVLSTFAGKERISQYNQMALEAGATVFNGDAFFIIRHRSSFYPQKDMKLKNNGDEYTIKGVVELDEPVNFLQLLCVRSR